MCGMQVTGIHVVNLVVQGTIESATMFGMHPLRRCACTDVSTSAASDYPSFVIHVTCLQVRGAPFLSANVSHTSPPPGIMRDASFYT